MRIKIFIYLSKFILISEFIDNATNLFPVFPDDGVAEYPKPHFLASRTEQYPAAFLRGTVPYLKVRMKLNCHPNTLPTGEVYIKGLQQAQSSYNVTFNPHNDLANIISENGDYFVEFQTTSPTQVSATLGGTHLFTFPDAIHHGKIILDWRCFLKVDGDWIRINPTNQITTLQVYITNAAPYATTLNQATLGGFAPFHSLYDISCKAAIGTDFRTEIISRVWNHIKSLHVTNKDGVLLTYYKYCSISILQTIDNTAKLLRFKDGQCYAWTDLFVDLLRIQGIRQQNSDKLWTVSDPTHNNTEEETASMNTIKILVVDDDLYNDCGHKGNSPTTFYSTYFVVNNVLPQIPEGKMCKNIACPGGSSTFRYVDKITNDTEYLENIEVGEVKCFADGSYEYKMASTISQINVQQGLPVQGHNGFAGNYFGTHGIVYIDNKYYDPSYGFGPFNDYNSQDYLNNIGGWGYEYISREVDEFGEDVDGDNENNGDSEIFFRFSKQNESTWKFKN